MNDDLIRREDALACFHDWIDKNGDVYTPDDMLEYRAIEQLPSVQEREAGKWKWSLADNGWADWTCSVCGYTKNTDIHVKLGWRYCPWCGSDLRGEENG